MPSWQGLEHRGSILSANISGSCLDAAIFLLSPASRSSLLNVNRFERDVEFLGQIVVNGVNFLIRSVKARLDCHTAALNSTGSRVKSSWGFVPVLLASPGNVFVVCFFPFATAC